MYYLQAMNKRESRGAHVMIETPIVDQMLEALCGVVVSEKFSQETKNQRAHAFLSQERIRILKDSMINGVIYSPELPTDKHVLVAAREKIAEMKKKPQGRYTLEELKRLRGYEKVVELLEEVD